MINVIIGAKGTGKTQRIIDKANECVDKAKGNVVFLTDKSGYTYHINHSIRLLMMEEYGLNSASEFLSFIKGLLAGNSDIEQFYIDGIHRICSCEIDEMEELFSAFDAMKNVKFTVALSIDENKKPKFLSKYIK